MAMKKLKSDEPLDRLSELPDSLIFDIFAFLPMTDVVRTTILSHRWRNLWTTVPNLNFDKSLIFSGKSLGKKFRYFVYGALLRWRGARVHKFKFWFPQFGDFSPEDFDLWVRFAIDKGAQDFDLRCDSTRSYVPQCVYYHSSLENLCLNSFGLKIGGNVKWNHLKSLTILECFGITQHEIDQIFCGSPLLEVLTLVLLVEDNLHMSFRSSSLKELSISRSHCYCRAEYPALLRIWTPNLETLTIEGDPYGKYLLEDISSLTRATLIFQCESWFGWSDDIGLRFFRLLASIQHAESITLLDWRGIKEIFALLDGPISPLPNVKFLELSVSFGESEDMVCFLEIFPNVKTLVLREQKDYRTWFNAKSNLEFKADNPSRSFVRELTTVEVIWDGLDLSIFPLIETLLKYASKLKKMVFRVKVVKPPSPPSNPLLLASQKLLGVERSSRKAVFIFCEY